MTVARGAGGARRGASESSLRIAVVAPARYPIREPYAGGLEAFCATLVDGLRRRGHEVDLYAARGSHGHERSFELPGVHWGDAQDQATDTGYPAGEKEREDAAFVALRQHLAAQHYDVVHNNSLNHGLFSAGTDRLPLVTTFHTPQLPEMQEAITRVGAAAGRFVAVSQTTAAAWSTPSPITVIMNGVDTSVWTPGDGGGPAVWFGRVVPEKAPHFALDACHRAGLPLVLAGRIGDQRYFDALIAPRLRDYSATYLGPLEHASLHRLVASCSVCLVTPEWEEPCGLVAFEAMAAGTPVAAFARGGLGELLRDAPAVLAQPGSVTELAAAVRVAATLPRGAVAAWVTRHFSLRAMARRYEQFYREMIAG